MLVKVPGGLSPDLPCSPLLSPDLPCSPVLVKVPGGSYVCSFAGESHKFHYDLEPGDRIRLTLDGKVVMLEKEKDPSVLVAPYAGKLTRYVVDDGAHLAKGEAYAEVEVMKMLFMLTVSEAGVITLAKGTGNVAIDAGERLGNLVLDDPTLVAKATPFTAELGDFRPPLEMCLGEGRLHHQLAFLTQRVHNILDGYVDNEEEVLYRLSEILLDPCTLCHEWQQLMMGVGSKLPQHVREKLQELTPSEVHDEPFGAKVLGVLEGAIEDAKDDAAATALRGQAVDLVAFGMRFKGGLVDMSTGVIRGFIEHFLRVEKFYPDDRSELLGVYNLTQAHPDDQPAALQGVLSHFNIERKVNLMLSVLDLLGVYTHMDASILNVLKELSTLMSTKHLRVQRKAKQIAANCQNNIVEQNKELVLPSLRKLATQATAPSEEEEVALVENLLSELTLAETKVLAMLGDSEKLLRKAVAKAAVLLWYSRYQCRNLSVRTYLRKGKEKLVVTWKWTTAEGTTKEGFLFVFSSLDDLEANFDDLVGLALKDRPAAAAGAPAASPAPKAPGGFARSYSGTGLDSASAATPTCLHVLVLGTETEKGLGSRGRASGPPGVAERRGSLVAANRQSFRYAILDEAQTSRMYHRALISKASALRQYGVDQVSGPSPPSMLQARLHLPIDHDSILPLKLSPHLQPSPSISPRSRRSPCSCCTTSSATRWITSPSSTTTPPAATRRTSSTATSCPRRLACLSSTGSPTLRWSADLLSISSQSPLKTVPSKLPSTFLSISFPTSPISEGLPSRLCRWSAAGSPTRASHTYTSPRPRRRSSTRDSSSAPSSCPTSPPTAPRRSPRSSQSISPPRSTCSSRPSATRATRAPRPTTSSSRCSARSRAPSATLSRRSRPSSAARPSRRRSSRCRPTSSSSCCRCCCPASPRPRSCASCARSPSTSPSRSLPRSPPSASSSSRLSTTRQRPHRSRRARTTSRRTSCSRSSTRSASSASSSPRRTRTITSLSSSSRCRPRGSR